MADSEGTPPPGADWRHAPQIRLSAILSASLEAFSEHGYHGTTVRDIARRVGVTVPALYYHHENKEAILYALLDTGIEHLRRLCRAALAEGFDEPAAKFLNLVEAIVLYMSNSGQLAHLDGEIRSLSPEHRKAYADKRGEIEDLLVVVIDSAVSEGIFHVAKPRLTARALLGMFQAIATWYRPTGPQSPREIALDYLEIASQCVGAEAGVVNQARQRRSDHLERMAPQ